MSCLTDENELETLPKISCKCFSHVATSSMQRKKLTLFSPWWKIYLQGKKTLTTQHRKTTPVVTKLLTVATYLNITQELLGIKLMSKSNHTNCITCVFHEQLLFHQGFWTFSRNPTIPSQNKNREGDVNAAFPVLPISIPLTLTWRRYVLKEWRLLSFQGVFIPFIMGEVWAPKLQVLSYKANLLNCRYDLRKGTCSSTGITNIQSKRLGSLNHFLLKPISHGSL